MAWIKSTCSFDFQQNEYQLKIIVEDGTRALQVTVAPALVERLIGIPSVQFRQQYNSNENSARAVVEKFERTLRTFDGWMKVDCTQPHAPVIIDMEQTESETLEETILFYLNRIGPN